MNTPLVQEAAHPAGRVPPARQLEALRSVALVAAHANGAALYDDLVRALAETLGTAAAFVAVFEDDARTRLRTLAARLDGAALAPFSYPLEGSPCARVTGRGLRYVANGVAAEFRPGTIFAAKGMDSYAAFPLADSAGRPLGLLVAMDRAPIAAGDEEHARSVIEILAARLAAEIEREGADNVLRSAALAVSGLRGPNVFSNLVRQLATLLGADVAFVSRQVPGNALGLSVLALYFDGEVTEDLWYDLAGTPCETVFGQGFRAYPDSVQARFPDDRDAVAHCTEGYAGYPLHAADGRSLGVIAIAAKRPLVHLDRIEWILKIFGVRASAEIERLIADEQLQRAAASYRAIFESAQDPVFVLEWETGRTLDVNPKACETYGYDRDTLCRLTSADLSSGLPPYTTENARAWFERAKRENCPSFEWHRRHRDGSLHWDEIRLVRASIDGRPHMLLYSREITQQKAAEAALRASEEQYRATFDSAADAMVLWDRHLRVVDVNASFMRMTGLSRTEVIGMPHGSRLHAGDAGRRLLLLRGALAGEEGHVETRVLHKDGSEFDAELRYVPVTFGGEAHALTIGRDISERVERERALATSEARLRATVEAAFDGIVGMDSEGCIVEFNAAAQRIFGHRREAVLGRKVAEVLVPERYRHRSRRSLPRLIESLHEGMGGRLVEAMALRADGAEIPVELAVSVATVPEGRIYVGHLRDITARRAAEAERVALETQLRQAQKMEAVGQLAGGIAHDFNNILTSVTGYVVLAQERAEATGDQVTERYLGQIHEAAKRARDLIGQMLAFARRKPGTRRPTALGPVVRQTMQLLRSALPSAIALECIGLCDNADAPGPRVDADPMQLEQVLFNLCINARDAIEGPGWIRVEADAVSGRWQCASCRAQFGEGPWMALKVSDNGSGIAPDVAERMFEPFYSTKPIGRGSGMGLAMVHGIVHDHGGHLCVDSAPGRGTVFSVLLPRVADGVQGTAAPGAAEPGPLASALARLHGRVVLVEDDLLVGDFLAERLIHWGLDIVLHRDPLEADRWLEDPCNAADVLLTDQAMPGMTGLELAARTAARRPDIAVVLVTAHAPLLDPAETRQAAVRAVIDKPVAAATLYAALADVLRTDTATRPSGGPSPGLAAPRT